MTTSAHADLSTVRWLVTGRNGQLGQELLALLAALGATEASGAVRAIGRAECDLSDPMAVQTYLDAWLADTSSGDYENLPAVVINTAAYTAVDAAESDEEAAIRGNVDAPFNLAHAIGGRARLIHLSTDYVFPGDASEPYAVDAPTGPRTAYGRTKLAGEQAVRTAAPDTSYIVRTAWVYGAYGPNFVKTMAKLAAQRETLQVVGDQIGSPTWTRHLALGLIELALSDAPAGVLHCTGGGQASWCEFAGAVFTELGLDPARVQPTTTDAFPRPAPRPAYSVLSATEWAEAGLVPLPDWRAALHEAFELDAEALIR